MCANILTRYNLATDTPDHVPRSWYLDAHHIAADLAIRFDTTVSQAAGVLAALSPSTAWERNVTLAYDLFETGDCSHAYGVQINKARRIIDGADPLTVLNGRKERSFYHNIHTPHRTGPVTVDRHAFSVALARILTDKELKLLDRSGIYHYVAACYRSVARQIGIPPHVLQSITWDHWRTFDAYGATTNIPAF